MTRSTVWNPEAYARDARFVSDLGEPVLRLLAPRTGERILDLGCGDGALTEKIAALGASVVGVDSSLAQVRAAKERHLRIVAMDAQRLGFRRRFDAVFTNAALHWIKQPEKTVQGVHRCLKPGSRFVGEFGGKGNVASIRSALHAGLRERDIDPLVVDPWFYPSTEEYSRLLAAYGFAVNYIELIPRPTQLPGDISAWLEIFAQPFTRSIPGAGRARFLADIRDRLEPVLRDKDGVWVADYVRLRFRAHKAA